MENPFSVTTPESLTPGLVAQLFIVEALSDYPQLETISHTFIHGSRGTGKSMMLRYLEPLVQLAANKIEKLSDLQFFAFHVPIRSANLTLPEFSRLTGSPFLAFAEHILVMRVGHKILSGMAELCDSFNLGIFQQEVAELYTDFFLRLLSGIGRTQEMSFAPETSKQIFELMAQICEDEILIALRYLKLLSFNKNLPPYQGSLGGYLDFLLPLAQKIQKLSFTPDSPVFVMVDDADNLTEDMQKILNSWVACRTTKYLCLKISTQMRYKTYRTLSDQLIESPHDYNEINVNTIYTSTHNDNYYHRVKAIVKRRLEVANIQIEPEDFFPENTEQEKRISQIGEDLRQRHREGKGLGYRASDDSTRYARVEYMSELSGTAKNSSTYSYAGFRSMVDISSGIIRQFLEPASLMWTAIFNQPNAPAKIKSIQHQIQDRVIKQWSEEFMLASFDKLRVSDSAQQSQEVGSQGFSYSERCDHLRTLLNSLGKAFRARVLDRQATERRLISIMVPDKLSSLVEDALKLGIQWNYLQLSTIGTKEGLGKKRQYILSRRLAPFFKLDPSGYAGYLSVTDEALGIACINSEQFVKLRILKEPSHSSTGMTDLFANLETE